MYLEKLTVSNLRKVKDAEFKFTQGLNIIVGPNNIGKTTVVDALRSLLGGHEEPYSRFSADDIHRPSDGTAPSGDITFKFVFTGLSPDDEIDFFSALVPLDTGGFEAHITVSYYRVDTASGRMHPKRWCGELEEISLNSEMLENLRGVYLQPLRDASQGLKPGRNSQLARLLRALGDEDEEGKEHIETTLNTFDTKLKATSPIKNTQTAIASRHESMLGKQLAQLLALGISGTDFNRLSARLTLQADDLEIDQNGLGFNNLVYMAVVLSEMVKDSTATYRGLIVEEPEAHLHPQLQSVLLEYLQEIESENDSGPVQVFVTSHSPTFSSIASLDSIVCMMETKKNIKTFHPRDVRFATHDNDNLKKRKKLERYLDVTRAELFFSRRVIFVEGIAELILMSVLSKMLGDNYNLRKHAVSLISVEGLNFDCFLPLFGKNAIQIPVAVITDADPSKNDPDRNMDPDYPALGEEVCVSGHTTKMKKYEDEFIKVFHGVKTFEYDLALHEENRELMITALEELHPKIAASLRPKIDTKTTDKDKAKTLFCGMFERDHSNVKKGQYAQALAQIIVDKNANFKVPEYIKMAIKHVCN